MRNNEQNKRSPDWPCACHKREAVCLLAWPTIRYIHVHDTRCTMHIWLILRCTLLLVFPSFFLIFFPILIYSHIFKCGVRTQYSVQQRPNKEWMKQMCKETREKKNAHFFPGGHIIADSESTSAYAIVVVVVVGFIQLASSPPRLHFAVACGTGSRSLYQSKL